MIVSFKEAYQNLSEIEQKLVMMRLKGASYKKIEDYLKIHDSEYSWNSHRKMIDEILHLDFEHYYEYKYDVVFRKIEWDEKSFVKVFDEPNIIYLFLNYRISPKGSFPVFEDLYTSKYKRDIEISNLVVSYFPATYIFWTLLLNPLNKRKRGYLAIDFLKAVRKQGIDAELEQFEYYLNKDENAIEIQKGEYIFFDGEKLKKSYNKFFRSLIRKKGLYSVDKIYEEDKEYYAELGIYSSTSLHDIAKKYNKYYDKNSSIKFLQYPNIVYGYYSKAEFFKSISNKYHNQSVEQVIDEIHNYGGVDKEYLLRNFKVINKDKLSEKGVIKAKKVEWTNRQLDLISNRLSKDYYHVEEFLGIIRKVKPSAPDRIIDTNLVRSLGYKKEHNYCIKICIQDIKKHLEKQILADEFLKFNLHDELDSIRLSVIDSLITDFKLIRITDDELITAKKMRQIGLYKKDILLFLKQVSENIGEHYYFTIKQLFEAKSFALLERFGFDIRFYEELIRTSKLFDSIRIDGAILYCATKDKVTRKDFIEWCFERFDESIHILDALEWINFQFRISVSQQTIRALAEEIGYYYDDSFEKIYKTKKLFLMEVFGHG